MEDLITKIATGKPINDLELADALYEICDRKHAACNNNCPVYKLNGSKAPDTANDFNVNCGCDCFKNGAAMLEFIRNKSK